MSGRLLRGLGLALGAVLLDQIGLGQVLVGGVELALVEALRGGEALVHRITIANGIASCVLLVLAYQHRGCAIPAMVLVYAGAFVLLLERKQPFAPPRILGPAAE